MKMKAPILVSVAAGLLTSTAIIAGVSNPVNNPSFIQNNGFVTSSGSIDAIFDIFGGQTYTSTVGGWTFLNDGIVNLQPTANATDHFGFVSDIAIYTANGTHTVSNIESMKVRSHLEGTQAVANYEGNWVELTIDSTYTAATAPVMQGYEFVDGVNNSSAPPNNMIAFEDDIHTNGNGLTSGTVINRTLYSKGWTGGDSGGVVDNWAADIVMPSGAQGAGTTDDWGEYIHGSCGSGANCLGINYTTSAPFQLEAPFGASGAVAAQGDTGYFNGTRWVDLVAGTNHQFLTTGGTSANPSWTSAVEDFMSKDVATFSVNQQYYEIPIGYNTLLATAFATAKLVLPRGGTMGATNGGEFSCNVATAPGSGESDTCTVQNSSGATSITCNITGTGTSCTDTSDTATFTAGSAFSFGFIANTGATQPGTVYESVSFSSP